MTPGGPGASPRYEFGVFASLNSLTNPAAREGGGSLMRPLARIIHERCAFVHNAPAAAPFLVAAGFDTALRAVLKTSPGRVLSEGPKIRA